MVKRVRLAKRAKSGRIVGVIWKKSPGKGQRHRTSNMMRAGRFHIGKKKK